MSGEPTIRGATSADLDALVRLLDALFSVEADFHSDAERQRRGLTLMLERPDLRCVLVAERAGAVVGMVTVQLVVSTAEGGPAGLVEDMVVDAAERGRGTRVGACSSRRRPEPPRAGRRGCTSSPTARTRRRCASTSAWAGCRRGSCAGGAAGGDPSTRSL